MDEYVRSRNIELGEKVFARERVYLDKCFWIALRDVHIGRSGDAHARTLLERLVATVSEGRRVCPLSDALFLELMKQTDPRTRLATAGLIDQLSCGITLAPQPTRIATETAHFLYARAGVPVLPLDILVWSRLSHVLGVQHPTYTAFPAEEQAVMQKAFFDHMSSSTLSEMVTLIGDAWPPDSPYAEMAERLNRANTEHAHLLRSFKKAYEDELFGVLDLTIPTAKKVLLALTKREGVGALVDPNNDAEIYDFLRSAATDPSFKLTFRTLHLGATLRAAVRWNRTKKFVANDLYDFHHAEAAVGYCNVFLTERPMHALLEQRHLALTPEFPCKIMSSREQAAAWAQ